MKQMIHCIIVLMFLMMPVAAHYDLSTDEEILYLYDTNDVSIKFTSSTFADNQLNPNKTLCVNSTCISGSCNNFCKGAYDLSYDFTYRISETEYQTVVVRLEQVITSSTWYSNYVTRKLYINGQETAHETDIRISKYVVNTNAFYFEFIFEDTLVKFNDQIITNQTLLFTEIDMSDQHLLLNENSKNNIRWHFITLSDVESMESKLGGLLGILYNVVDRIPMVGTSIQNIIFLPLFLLQTVFDFSATFITIIISDWYYSLMLVQIICMAKALRSKNDVYHIAQDYLLTNVLIIMYIKDHLVMPFITLVLKIIVIIRNMFRI